MCLSPTRGRPTAPRAPSSAHLLLARLLAAALVLPLASHLALTPSRAAACSPSHAPLAHRAAPLRGARLCHALRAPIHAGRGLALAVLIAALPSRAAHLNARSLALAAPLRDGRRCASACAPYHAATHALRDLLISARRARAARTRAGGTRPLLSHSASLPRLALGLQHALSSWPAAQAPPPWGATASRHVHGTARCVAPCACALSRTDAPMLRPAAWGPKTSRTPSGKRWAMAQRRSVWGRTPSRTLTPARCACSPCRCALRPLLSSAQRGALAHAGTVQRQRDASPTLAPLFRPLADSFRACPRRRTR